VEPLTDQQAPVLRGADTLPPMRSDKQTGTHPIGGSKPNRASRKQTANRFGCLNAFVDCSMAGLSRAELATWLVLYRDERGGSVCISQQNIARRAGASVRHVKKAIANLVSMGLLTVVYQGGLNRGPSRFRVNPLGTRGS
jgi:hypothetical protein